MLHALGFGQAGEVTLLPPDQHGAGAIHAAHADIANRQPTQRLPPDAQRFGEDRTPE